MAPTRVIQPHDDDDLSRRREVVFVDQVKDQHRRDHLGDGEEELVPPLAVEVVVVVVEVRPPGVVVRVDGREEENGHVRTALTFIGKVALIAQST